MVMTEIQERRIMCTIGGLGRHIGRQSTDILVGNQPTIGRQSTDSQPTVNRQSTDSHLIYRPIVDQYITRYVHIYWLTVGRYIGRLSVDSRPIYRLTVSQCISRYVHIYRSTVGRSIGQLSTNSRPIVGR